MRPDPRALEFHRRLPGYEPTHLAAIEPPGIAGAQRMVVKLETARFGLPSFKVLGASWASARRVAEWLAGGAPDRLDLLELRSALEGRPARPALMAATDGNHGRAVAWTARQLGLAAEIFVPAGTADARRAAIVGEGAVVTVVDGDYDETVAAAADAATGDRLLVQDTAVPGHEAVVDAVIDGYSTIFAELDAQLAAPTETLVLVVPVGVGSLAVAAARYARSREARTVLVTVEPIEAASLQRSLELGRLVSLPGPHASCMVGLRCGTISPSAWPVLATATDVAVALADVEADDAMRALAERGIEVGECGAASLAAVAQLASDDRLAPHLNGGPAAVALIATEGPTDPERWARVVGRSPR